MVLLVDDQVLIGESIRRLLVDDTTIDFHFCSDAEQALATAERIQPMVILQDLVMPGADGVGMVRQYRAHPATTDIPIIVLSTR
jgi:two-component system chemotaxis family response regulator WspR